MNNINRKQKSIQSHYNTITIQNKKGTRGERVDGNHFKSNKHIVLLRWICRYNTYVEFKASDQGC